MSREDVLLKEYEVCQQAIDTNISRYWTVVSIFIGINAVFLGAITYWMAAYPCRNVEGLVRSILISVIGVVMIYNIFSLKRWLGRVNWLVGAKYFRMREIEVVLGMRANLIIDAVDHWEKLSCQQRKELKPLHEDHVRPYKALRAPRIYCSLIVLWGIFIVAAWVLPYIVGWFNKAG